MRAAIEKAVRGEFAEVIAAAMEDFEALIEEEVEKRLDERLRAMGIARQ